MTAVRFDRARDGLQAHGVGIDPAGRDEVDRTRTHARCEGHDHRIPPSAARRVSVRAVGAAAPAQLRELPHPGARATPRTAQRGYTLIEVIVAFALLALGLTLLLGTLSGAVRQVRWSSDAGRAALHAQSLLDQTGLGEPLRPGTREGEFDDGRYRWTLAVAPWTDPTQPPAATTEPAAARLFELQLAVQWSEGGPRERLQLRTLRLVPVGTEATLP